MEGSPGDLQTRYHKLAGEYSKCRAQLSVLKKAFQEEQQLNSELKESLREAEQSLRKADQEADSLNFRNEQLTCRVTVLQNELDALQIQMKNKKGKIKIPDGQPPLDISNHVLDEEFRKKIQENARLLSLMNEKEDQHRQELTNVTSQLDQVTFELSQLRKSSAESEEKSRVIIAKLEREMSCMREGQQQLSDVSHELAQLRQTHAEYKTKMEAKVNTLNTTISSHLPFIDSKKDVLNSLNVPQVMDTKDNLTSGLGEDLRASLQQMAASLALWHKVTENRLQTLPTGNSAVHSKAGRVLSRPRPRPNARPVVVVHHATRARPDQGKECFTNFSVKSVEEVAAVMHLYRRYVKQKKKRYWYASHLKETGELALELEQNLSPSKICKTVIQKLPGLFGTYCSNVETMLVHQRLSLEEENVDPKDETLRESNEVFLGNCSQLVSHFVQINSRIALYKSMQHSAEAQQKHQRGLISVALLLQESFKDLFNAYVIKSGIEGERNWATEDLNTANQSITNSISSLMESSAKIAKCLQELWKVADTMQPPHPAVTDMRRRGVHYINAIHTDEAPSIPYSQALKDHEEAANSSQLRQALLQQLEENRHQLVVAEQQRDMWRQELQLLQLRYQKEMKEIVKDDEYPSLVNSTVTNMIGSLDIPVNLPREVESREEAVKLYFRDRINQLISENSELQSKSVALMTETKLCIDIVDRQALVRRLEARVSSGFRLEASVSSGFRLEAALYEARKQSAQLQEETTALVRRLEASVSSGLRLEAALYEAREQSAQLQEEVTLTRGQCVQ
ncbi:protein phosphatase 1 regulatory subunit 21 [Macrosteles quadrilineatus]|uniref:protein phosphatase 1 regulatory subunit 21 n=1 Tax=Macrosteles quadrilineatus TaxID=74068 RepID=UPI0023E11B08|nr:protein phosphatase 1 regulatory subunit 21 [Macrosteles quadrilineatus]